MREEIISFLREAGQEPPFHVQMTGISYCDGSYRISRRNSPIYVFEYVIEGRGTLVVNSAEYHPCKGDIYIAPRDSNHHYFSDVREPWTKIWFNMEGALVERLLDAYGLAGVHHVPDCNLLKLFEEGLRCARKDPGSAQEKIALVIHRIIQGIARVLKLRGAKLIHNSIALRLRDYLDGHLHEEIGIEKLSAVAHRSPSQVIRLFKSEWGASPCQYLLSRRMESARTLLAETALTVKEISERLGFKDEYYFAALFKRKAGLAPGRYRRTARGL